MLGGSTTFGFPLRETGTAPTSGPQSGFVGIVQATLEKAAPGRFEVLNLGINGGASSDTLRLLRRADDWHADAVVIYDGHNEFLSAPARFSSGLWRFALYRQVGIGLPRVTEAPGWSGPAAHGSSRHAQAVLDLFRSNLISLVDLARAQGSKVILVTQAGNLRGIDPNWSTGPDVETIQAAARAGLPELQRLRSAHPESADVAWQLGRQTAGRDSIPHLQAAVDQDGLQLRASSAINRVILDVVGQTGVVLVDAARLSAQLAAEALDDGEPLFFDWVHPRSEVSALIGRGVLDGLTRAGVVSAETPVLVAPEISQGSRIEGELRSARSWLQWACVRHHDPALRLSRARSAAAWVLKYSPADIEAASIELLASGWGEGAVNGIPIEVAERLGSLHPCIQERVGRPPALGQELPSL